MINFFDWQNFDLLNYSNTFLNGYNFQFFNPPSYISFGTPQLKVDRENQPGIIYLKKKDARAYKSYCRNSGEYDVDKIAFNKLRSMPINKYAKGYVPPENSIMNTEYKVSLSRSPEGIKSIAFLNKTKAISQKLNCDYKDLLAVMNIESGLNPYARNKRSGASGLIQFMPTTAKGLGTTVEQIRGMKPEKQLDYVEKYLTKVKKSRGFSENHKLSAGELYALVFLPSRAKREVLCRKGETSSDGKLLKYYEWNKGLDTNHDGMITKSELNARVKKHRVDDSYFA